MGNQTSVGWASKAAEDEELLYKTWNEFWTGVYTDFTDEQLRIESGKNRQEYFTAELKGLLQDSVNKRILIYRNNNVFGFTIVHKKKKFVQIYGMAVAPYKFSNVRAAAHAMATKLKEEYPEEEFRGMVRAVNERGRKLYKYLGAVECKKWHDPNYDEHHIPLRIPSSVAKKALSSDHAELEKNI